MMSILQTQDFNEEAKKLVGEQKCSDTDLGVLRSGSAPPTVERSLSSINGLFEGSDFLGHKKLGENAGFLREDNLRADPAYANYYYSNWNVNPRLPPPLLSKEDWRFSQRNRSNFAVFDGEDENSGSGRWGDDGLIGLGSGQKSIAEVIQDDMSLKTGVSRLVPLTTCHNAFEASVKGSVSKFSHLHHDLASDNYLQYGANKQGILNVGSSSSLTYASALGSSLSRNANPDSNRINAVSESLTVPDELASIFFRLNLSQNGALQKEDLSWSHPLDETSDLHNPFDLQGKIGQVARKMNNCSLMSEGLIETDSSYLRYPYKYSYNHDTEALDSPVSLHAHNGFSLNPLLPAMVVSQRGNCNLPPLYKKAAGSLALGSDQMGAAEELQNIRRMTSHPARNSLQSPLVDPSVKYVASNRLAAAQVTALNEAAFERDYFGGSYVDFLDRAYIDPLIVQEKTQYGFPHHSKSGCNYFENQAFGLGSAYLSTRYSRGPGNHYAGFVEPWNVEIEGNLDESFVSMLDELKSNKTRGLELSEIAGHVVDFSADQYGSRFIQQKLETATMEEKNMVFDEIMPKALSLMTDVFGNYVVQKFLEHGTPSQIRELANNLMGNVLALSLQMYGCRVIQKALEVVELDQKTEMLKELDGHVMRCVRDQNGNHVIQKGIERVPEDAIRFIISTFYDHVVTLSIHPYGCRIIQRVLEHCHEEKTQRIMMDEILHSVSKLAQDQYGNYVVQHVLEHGKPHERSAIITKLTGQIVRMSQQKYASNVVEKCLAFGTPTECKNLVNEMLGSTDENEPLQVMMKDQFGNYVVQKVLETCDDQQLELILNRIKVHLNALKKYTYGKHIVARVEKLVAAGERRISVLGLNSL